MKNKVAQWKQVDSRERGNGPTLPLERHLRGEVREVGVLERLEGRQAPAGIESHELLQQINARIPQPRHQAADLQRGPHGERLVPVLQACYAGPRLLRGRAQYPEDFEKLIHLAVAREEGSLGDHFGQNGSHSPHVHWQGVRLAAEENFRGTVPQSHDLREEGDGKKREARRRLAKSGTMHVKGGEEKQPSKRERDRQHTS